MGWGDEIMVTGEARRLQATDPRPVRVLDRRGDARWHPLWEGNDRFAEMGVADAQVIVNGPGARPYVDYTRTMPDRWAYTGWQATPGELPAIPCAGIRVGALPFVVIEPAIKSSASPNKQWGAGRWQALVDILRRRHPDLIFVHLGPVPVPGFDGLVHVPTEDVFAACAVLAAARAAILPEGGLHHAAAALGVPAVVLFGGMTSPRNTGYGALPGSACHINLAVDDAEALGWRVPHPACAAAWDRITPALVADTFAELLFSPRDRVAA
ncbi:hypothetical protein EDC65_2247 [Stella humosa]|uniref:Glycosyl transferase family 9 (Putative heptosyltransferase) n=1 Tax=Stella humosa TaxID=94 RepID=A0A3N1M9Y5_9PROT|nr:hypothetical protein [Stella humosa]ROQ00448.1 hypothetical protein EDC65_2247 [Stella humosa]BBK30307.1 hypothetical protein STHU_09410 [Stella humosa]